MLTTKQLVSICSLSDAKRKKPCILVHWQERCQYNISLKRIIVLLLFNVAKLHIDQSFANCKSTDDPQESTWSIETDFRILLESKTEQSILTDAKLACLHYGVHLQNNRID